jgi:integrase
MASIIERNGKRTLQWKFNNRRWWAGLGATGAKAAAVLANRLQAVLDEIEHTGRLSGDSTAWLSSLRGRLRQRLYECGVLSAEPTVRQLCDAFEVRKERKEQTNVNYSHAIRNLVKCYGLDTPASAVQGREFRPYLESRGLSRSTVNKRIAIAKSVFKTITPNPFAEVTAGRQDNSDRQFYVAADTILAVCRYADPELKLVLMLARFAGLRVPSELRAMRFSDIEWEHDKIYIRSPKTEHHKGGEGRYIPLFHQVRHSLLEAFDRAGGGSDKVFSNVSGVSNVGLRIRLTKTLGRLGIRTWPRLFQNLRASWETDCLKLWPAETPKWAGHSHLVSQRSYHMQTDDSFRAAAAPPPAQFAANRSSGQGVGDSTSGSVTHAGQSAYIGASGILPGLKPACNSRPNRARAAVGATTKRRQNLLARSFRRSGGGRNG